jgi:hypothetical protein
MRKLGLLFLMSAAVAGAQSLSVGVIGGANFNDVVNAATAGNYKVVSNSDNFTIGPSLRVNLPASFRLEVDALYRPYGFNYVGTATTTGVSGQQWRFPVLLQYRFGNAPIVHPFVEAGLSFDHLSGISSAAKSVIATGPGALLHQSNADFVIGGGLDVKVPFVRLSGEIRYSRATVSDFANISNVNQAEVLFGVHF